VGIGFFGDNVISWLYAQEARASSSRVDRGNATLASMIPVACWRWKPSKPRACRRGVKEEVVDFRGSSGISIPAAGIGIF
jgi:hypothetical protein